MYSIVSNSSFGKITISDKFDVYGTNSTAPDACPVFLAPNDEYILTFPDLENVTKITKFSYDTLGLNDTRYLTQFFRISNNMVNWSEWLPLNRSVDGFPQLDPKEKLHLEIKWQRKGTSTVGSIKIIEYKIEGEIDRFVENLGSTINLSVGQMKIIQSPFIFKVFSISDIEIISTSHPDVLPSGVSIKYRYSQDSTRTWSKWEPLSKENITSVRINPIRFFQIEYMIENNSNTSMSIQDINLIGDFQNVSNDYQKSNLFGVRECCQSNLYGSYDKNGNFIPNTNLNSSGGGPACDVNVFKPMSDDEKANLYNPYAQNTAVKLLEKLSNDSQQMFGHQVIYFATDPDKKGQDHILNEYQLYNIVCQGDLKVSIEGNNFPDSQIVMNQFDLNLFETMEAHITKQQFKQVFGVQRRPSKEDFLYFCNLNRMYQVDHAQQFRGFNNNAVYYKLILKKYTQKSNVQPASDEVKNTIDKLTKNTTIDELMGFEQDQEKASIANKPQFAPLTREKMRLEIFAEIDKELIENSSTIIAKTNYDLASVNFGTPGVVYYNFDPRLKVSNNLSYQIWFNLHNYIPDEVYSFFDFYDEELQQGFRTSLSNDKITVTLNTTNYEFNLNSTFDSSALNEETWYCYLINLDQKQRNLQQYIYKRNVEDEEDAADLTNTILQKVYFNSQSIEPIEYSIRVNPVIKGSDMKVTNIRLFSEVLPENVHTKMLNQYIIGEDSKYLIFADNATTRLYLPRFPLFE
jgi:hypothetical protein